MSLLKLICSRYTAELESENRRLKQLVLPPPVAPTIKGYISGTEIFELYAEIFPNDARQIYISDETYEITAISEIRRFVAWSNVNAIKYVPELLDCDDFALALAGEFARYPGWSGFPVTFIWGEYAGGHAFCTAVAWPSFTNRTPAVYYIEPQNDWEIAAESVEGTRLWLLPMRKVTSK